MLADHFDVDSMDMLREVMEEEFADLLTVYIDDSAQRLPKLRSALQAGASEELRELAHSFKGASGNISAYALAALCFEMEKAAKAGELDGLDELLGRIEQEFNAVQSHLREMI